MRRPQSAKPVNPVTCRLLLWLVAALLFGQSFGSIHRIVHTPSGDSALVQTAVAHGANAAPSPGVGVSSLAHWFGGHSASACALIDHALQPAPLAVPALLPTPLRVAALAPSAMLGIVAGGRPSPFEARGPPSLFR